VSHTMLVLITTALLLSFEIRMCDSSIFLEFGLRLVWLLRVP
jgi:hypothetical protein